MESILFQKRLSWTDYEDKIHTKKFNNVFYFPDSPFNVLSAAALNEPMKDYEGTWLLTEIKFTIFLGVLVITKREYLTYKIVLQNYRSNLDLASLWGFCKRVGSIPMSSTFNCSFVYIFTQGAPSTSFTTEAEDEVIRQAVSQKLDRPLLNPSKTIEET